MAPDHLCNLGELTLQECNAIVVVVFLHRRAPKISFDVIILKAANSRADIKEGNELGKRVFWQT